MTAPRLVPVHLPPSPELAPGVGSHLRRGGLVAYPTETVYGFGCRVREGPLEHLRRLKFREPDRPFLLLVSGPGAAADLRWTPAAVALAETFWPGPLTLVLADPEEGFPPGVRSPSGTVGVRESPHPVARALVDLLGEPLVSSSANPPGEPPASSGPAALAAAQALGAGEELWVLDAGPLPPSPPSTIVDCSGDEPRILRVGAVAEERVRAILLVSSGP